MTWTQFYEFWFGDGAGPREMWFKKNDAVDAEIKSRFAPLLDDPPAGEDSPRARLAEIILFDQIPRNAFRGTPRSFAYDDRALGLSKTAIARGDLERLSVTEALFLLLPLEHAENVDDQRECVRQIEALERRAPPELKAFAAEILDFAKRHERIVARFGRFPHRNAILGRQSTAEEAEFLKQPGSGF